MKQVAALVVASALATGALAQGPATGPAPGVVPSAGFGSAMSPEELRRATEIGVSLANEMLRAYEERVTPEMVQEARRVRQRFDDIASEALTAERRRILEFLGIDPDGSSALFVFVSWSMPLELLRAYALEAMWSGATLVVRGVPPGRDFGDFLTNDLRELVYGKAAAHVALDPRMFDAFQVRAVPAIVLSKVMNNFECQGVEQVRFQYQGQELSYDACPPLPENAFLKMSGAVSLSYALQAFVDDGHEVARPYLRALASGWREGKPPGRDQVPFRGEWRSVLSPEEKKAAIEAAGWPSSIGTVRVPPENR